MLPSRKQEGRRRHNNNNDNRAALPALRVRPRRHGEGGRGRVGLERRQAARLTNKTESARRAARRLRTSSDLRQGRPALRQTQSRPGATPGTVARLRGERRAAQATAESTAGDPNYLAQRVAEKTVPRAAPRSTGDLCAPRRPQGELAGRFCSEPRPRTRSRSTPAPSEREIRQKCEAARRRL